jgi:hypothetical protein
VDGIGVSGSPRFCFGSAGKNRFMIATKFTSNVLSLSEAERCPSNHVT